MEVKKQQLEPDMGQWKNWERSTSRLYIVTLLKFNLYADYIMWNGRLDEAQSWKQDFQEKY